MKSKEGLVRTNALETGQPLSGKGTAQKLRGKVVEDGERGPFL